MKRVRVIWMLLSGLILLIGGCSGQGEASLQEKQRLKVGVMLSDVGLGDQSFSDAAFMGLMQA